MTLQLWSPKQLLRRLRDDRMDAIPSYFLDNFFRGTHYSDDRDILINELPAMGRKLAPFVLPTEQGKPIAEFKGQTMKALTPPYIKPKDVVRPEDARSPFPEEVLDGPLSLQARFNRRVGEIQDQHIRAIRMQEAWMAARAVIDGQVTIKYQRDQGFAYPEATISFGRAANQTVVLTDDFWSETGAPILDHVETWANRMQRATYGQHPTVLLVGAEVAPYFKKNTQVKDELDTQRRGTAVNIPTGIQLIGDGLTYIGTLGAGIEVWCYRDYVEDADGSLIDILDPKDVVLLAPGFEGVRAYGAIYDVDAMQGGSMSIDIFAKMFKTDDPGEMYVMHQSSPLPIPLYPNRSLKATVLE